MAKPIINLNKIYNSQVFVYEKHYNHGPLFNKTIYFTMEYTDDNITLKCSYDIYEEYEMVLRRYHRKDDERLGKGFDTCEVLESIENDPEIEEDVFQFVDMLETRFG